MSNIALFKSGSVIPEYLRSATDDITQEIAGSSGNAAISIKGGVWRMIVGGEEVATNEERAMNFVVIAATKGVSRTFYAEKYEEGKDIKPTCWSTEGVAPNPEVPAPQSKRCETCPQNIEGSGDGKSRACRYSKRLAVALENDIEGHIFRLNVPAKSYFGKAEGDKMGLKAFGNFLKGHGIPITGIVTEARFDTSEAVPVLKFRAVRPLSQPEWEAAKARSTTEEVRSLLELRFAPSKKEDVPALPQAFAEAPIPSDAVEAEPAAPAEPVKRAKPKETVQAPKDVQSVLDEWATDDE